MGGLGRVGMVDWGSILYDWIGGVVGRGVAWCGVARRGVVWCGVVWCGVVWCGVVWCGMCRLVVELVGCVLACMKSMPAEEKFECWPRSLEQVC